MSKESLPLEFNCFVFIQNRPATLNRVGIKFLFYRQLVRSLGVAKFLHEGWSRILSRFVICLSSLIQKILSQRKYYFCLVILLSMGKNIVCKLNQLHFVITLSFSSLSIIMKYISSPFAIFWENMEKGRPLDSNEIKVKVWKLQSKLTGSVHERWLDVLQL
jgi:hypothetical protein